MRKVAIFASGTGSNFERLADAPELKSVMAIQLLVCDRGTAPVIEKATQRGIPTFVFSAKDFVDKVAYETEILSQVAECELIVLAGYMRVISPYFLEHFKGTIVNLHPSLLPKYKGKDAIKRAYEAGDEIVGISVHYVNEELDGGEVIAQATLQRAVNETLAQLTERIHVLEHELLPQVIYRLMTQPKGEVL